MPSLPALLRPVASFSRVDGGEAVPPFRSDLSRSIDQIDQREPCQESESLAEGAELRLLRIRESPNWPSKWRCVARRPGETSLEGPVRCRPKARGASLEGPVRCRPKARGRRPKARGASSKGPGGVARRPGVRRSKAPGSVARRPLRRSKAPRYVARRPQVRRPKAPFGRGPQCWRALPEWGSARRRSKAPLNLGAVEASRPPISWQSQEMLRLGFLHGDFQATPTSHSSNDPPRGLDTDCGT
jgi:hypothetical protein